MTEPAERVHRIAALRRRIAADGLACEIYLELRRIAGEDRPGTVERLRTILAELRAELSGISG